MIAVGRHGGLRETYNRAGESGPEVHVDPPQRRVRTYSISWRRGAESSSARARQTRSWLASGGPGARVILAKPLTFMNRSGDAVGVLARYFRIERAEMLLVVDDANLSLGRLRARPDGSDGGHNGLRSVIEALGNPVSAAFCESGSVAAGNAGILPTMCWRDSTAMSRRLRQRWSARQRMPWICSSSLGSQT